MSTMIEQITESLADNNVGFIICVKVKYRNFFDS